MRKCVRGWPYELRKRLAEDYDQKVTRKGAWHKIEALKEYGYILDFTPVVNPDTFGSPHLISIVFDESYRDVQSYIDLIDSFLETKDGFALIASYSFKQEKMMMFYCIIVTRDINQFYREMMNKVPLDRNIVNWTPLSGMKGILDFGMDSLKVPEADE